MVGSQQAWNQKHTNDIFHLWPHKGYLNSANHLDSSVTERLVHFFFQEDQGFFPTSGCF